MEDYFLCKEGSNSPWTTFKWIMKEFPRNMGLAKKRYLFCQRVNI